MCDQANKQSLPLTLFYSPLEANVQEHFLHSKYLIIEVKIILWGYCYYVTF